MGDMTGGHREPLGSGNVEELDLDGGCTVYTCVKV